jgi:hypothetical protein
MRRRVLRSMGTGRPSRVFPEGGSPLPSMGDRCRSGGSGHARAVRVSRRPTARPPYPTRRGVRQADARPPSRRAPDDPTSSRPWSTRPGELNALEAGRLPRRILAGKRWSETPGRVSRGDEPVRLAPGPVRLLPRRRHPERPSQDMNGGKRGSRLQAEHRGDRRVGRCKDQPRQNDPK